MLKFKKHRKNLKKFQKYKIQFKNYFLLKKRKWNEKFHFLKYFSYFKKITISN